MLRFTLFMFLITAAPYCPGCHNCLDPDGGCANVFPFRIVDKTTGEDMVVGTSPVYNKDTVHLLLTANRSGGGTYLMNGSYFNKEDSVFRSSVHWRVDTFFLYLDQFDTDTLLTHYSFVRDKCCPGDQYGLVAGIFLNGAPVQKSGEVFLLRK